MGQVDRSNNEIVTFFRLKLGEFCDIGPTRYAF